MTNYTLLEADYHRNGVGGAGFYVALFHDHNDDRRKLLTWFPTDDAEHGPIGRQDRVAVIDVDEAATGNIYMHPRNRHKGGNAWRGADSYSDLLPLVRDVVREDYDTFIAGVAKRD
jgi:hypothetical protein